MNRYLLILSTLICAVSAQAQEFEVYVSDAPNFGMPPWQILKYDRNGENPQVFIDQNLDWPHDMVFLEQAGTVLVSNYNSGRIDRFDAQTGGHIDIFAESIPGPTRMKIGPDGLLYVLSSSANARVKRFQLDGTFLGDFTSVSLPRCLGMDWDARGYLYVSSYDYQIVRGFDTEGTDQGTFAFTNLNGPTNIWFDDDGDLLVLDYDAGVVARFDQTGTYQGDHIQGLSRAEGMDFLPNGSVLIGNGGTNSVKSFTPEGDFIEDFITSQSGGLTQPSAVIVRVDQVNINAGMNDAWFNPATNGQGFLISVFPGIKQMFLAWFTFDIERPPGDVEATLGDPGHRWLTAYGPYTGNKASLTVELTEGGVFDSNDPPARNDGIGDGVITIEFADCSEALLTYELDTPSISGEIPIERIAHDNVALCETLSDQ